MLKSCQFFCFWRKVGGRGSITLLPGTFTYLRPNDNAA